MREKPRSLLTASLLVALMPWICWIAVSLGAGVPPHKLQFAFIASQRPFGKWFYIAPLLLGGVVSLVRKWAYFIFLLGEAAFSAFWLYRIRPPLNEIIILQISFTLIGSLICAIYFLRPTVRRLFMDASLRWWQMRSRYRVKMAGWLVNQAGTKIGCEIQDISEGGTFAVPSQVTAISDLLGCKIAFNVMGKDYEVPITAIYRRESDGGYGMSFHFIDAKSKIEIKSLCRALKRIKMMTRDPKRPLSEYLSTWIKEM